jgi:hypothetical protein
MESSLGNLNRHRESPADPLTLFVEPQLSGKSEITAKAEEGKIAIDVLCPSNDNHLIIGKRESGRTSILQYIQLFHVAPERLSAGVVPMYIDFQQLPGGKNKVLNAFRNALTDCQAEEDFDGIVSDRRCIFLIDNLDFANKKGISHLREFIAEHSEHRFVVAVDQDLLDTFRGEELRVGSMAFERIYVHPFGRKQIRQLADIWCNGAPEDVQSGELADSTGETKGNPSTDKSICCNTHAGDNRATT